MKKIISKKTAIIIIFILSFLLMLVSYAYGDILVTTRHSINFWKILFDGNILKFYDLNILASGNDFFNSIYGCYYNIVTYIIFAVWNMPLSILFNFTSIDVMNNQLCIIYMKLLPVLFLFLSAKVLSRIMKEIKVEEGLRKICIFLFFSSVITLVSVLVLGQYDIISIYFQLLSLLAYVKNDDKKFLLWSSIAFCCKYFSILIFLPLLIHKYKNIWKIVVYCLLMMVPFIITSSLFKVSEVAYENGFMETASTQIIARIFKDTNILYPLFVVIYVLLLVWCYINKKDDYKYSFIYICLIAMASFFGLLNGYIYWCVMMVPYVILLISISPKIFELNIILETIGSIGLMVGKIIRYPGGFYSEMLKPMFINNMFPEKLMNSSMVDIFIDRMHDAEQWDIIPRVIFMTAFACIIYCSYKENKEDLEIKYNDTNTLLLIRTIMVCGFSLLPLLAVLFRFTN